MAPPIIVRRSIGASASAHARGSRDPAEQREEPAAARVSVSLLPCSRATQRSWPSRERELRDSAVFGGIGKSALFSA